MIELIYDRFMEKAVSRLEAIKQGHPLDNGRERRFLTRSTVCAVPAG